MTNVRIEVRSTVVAIQQVKSQTHAQSELTVQTASPLPLPAANFQLQLQVQVRSLSTAKSRVSGPTIEPASDRH